MIITSRDRTLLMIALRNHAREVRDLVKRATERSGLSASVGEDLYRDAGRAEELANSIEKDGITGWTLP